MRRSESAAFRIQDSQASLKYPNFLRIGIFSDALSECKKTMRHMMKSAVNRRAAIATAAHGGAAKCAAERSGRTANGRRTAYRKPRRNNAPRRKKNGRAFSQARPRNAVRTAQPEYKPYRGRNPPPRKRGQAIRAYILNRFRLELMTSTLCFA